MLLILVLIKGIFTQYNGRESTSYNTTPLRLMFEKAIDDGDHSTGAI